MDVLLPGDFRVGGCSTEPRTRRPGVRCRTDEMGQATRAPGRVVVAAEFSSPMTFDAAGRVFQISSASARTGPRYPCPEASHLMSEQEPATPSFNITPRPLEWLRCRDNNRARFTVRPSFRSIQTRIRYARATGIRFEHQTPLERGMVLALQLQTGVTGITCIRSARVVGAPP